MESTEKLLLDGVRIIDLTTTYAGPIASKICSEMGAEVIKIEAIQRWDMTRGLCFPDNEPGDEPWNRGGIFHEFNNNKLGIAVNLGQPKGQEILKKLVELSDVVIENFSPRVMRNWQLDYENLRQVNDRLIMVSISGFGQTGPWKDRAAYAPVMEACAGFASFTLDSNGEPQLSIGLGDLIAGVAAVAGMLLALINRKRNGEGEYIDVAGREAMLCHIGEAIMDYVMNSRVWDRDDCYSWGTLESIYPCKGNDEWIVISINGEQEWVELCQIMGGPDWTRDDKFSNVLKRWQNREEVKKLIGEWTYQFDHFYLMEVLQNAGIAGLAVLNCKEIIFNPHLLERKFPFLVEQPGITGVRPFPRFMPVHLSGVAEVGSHRPAPMLGQDNEKILTELLGFSKEEMTKLEEEKIIGIVPLNFPRTKGLNIDSAVRNQSCTIDGSWLRELIETFGE